MSSKVSVIVCCYSKDLSFPSQQGVHAMQVSQSMPVPLEFFFIIAGILLLFNLLYILIINNKDKSFTAWEFIKATGMLGCFFQGVYFNASIQNTRYKQSRAYT